MAEIIHTIRGPSLQSGGRCLQVGQDSLSANQRPMGRCTGVA